MSHSETPSATIVSRRNAAKRRACSGERRSGRVTISMSGVPQRLKSTTAPCEPARRPPPPPSWIVLAASSSRCTRSKPTTSSPSAVGHGQLAAAAERFVVLADLVRLGRVGIEVVLAVERASAARSRDPSASPTRDRPLDGRAVGDRQRARLRECRPGRCACWARRRSSFGQRQNILLRVESWTWISRPITASQPAGTLMRAPASAGGRGSNASAPSSACAGRQQPVLAERRARPGAARPAGPPRARRGARAPGRPERLTGSVKRSQAYIASGSSTSSPMRNATVGEVGVSSSVAALEGRRRNRAG